MTPPKILAEIERAADVWTTKYEKSMDAGRLDFEDISNSFREGSRKGFQLAQEIYKDAIETLKWYAIEEHTECPNECAGVPEGAANALSALAERLGETK